jgi:outer membrane protein OmpA-like peptidoglycan-associated protein
VYKRQTLEISGDKNGLYAFEKEHNTVWYRFRVPYDCQLSFDIIPLNTKDDYDFILYKFTGKNFCADVFKKTAKPVRTCISRFDPALGSRTGLKEGATDEFIHSGPGSSYCAPLNVKKGEIYVLVLDNVYPKGKGHTLKLHYKRTAPVTAQQTNVQQTNTLPQSLNIKVKVIDKVTRDPIKANVQIMYKKYSDAPPRYVADSTKGFDYVLDLNTAYFIRAEAIHYFGCMREIRAVAGPTSIVVTMEMERIAVGHNVSFDAILFVGGCATFLNESIPALETVLRTMEQNPKLVIQVEGHVNCPRGTGDCDGKGGMARDMALSEARAKAVVEYLVEKGIAPERMTYKGYGATRMLYPEARSEDKMQQNRRVEIAIVSNE